MSRTKINKQPIVKIKYVASLNPSSTTDPKPPAEKFGREVIAAEDIERIYLIELTPRLINELRAVTLDELNAKLEKEKMVLKYKPVSRRKKPVPSVIPESVKVVRRFPSDPLEFLPKLPFQAPTFVHTSKLTAERMKTLALDKNRDIWPEERKLIEHIVGLNERSIAFAEEERGTFRRDYFSDYQMPVLEHEPWTEKNIPLPKGYQEEILRLLHEKRKAGVYEDTQSSYRSRWFCVAKKNGELRIVHDLQQLNSISVMDSGVPPILEEFVESFAGRAVYSVLDMYWGFYARTVDPKSRDMTAFQTPLGPMRIVSLPMGYTNSPAEFQACMMFILQDEVPEKAGVFIDDIPIKGPATEYLGPDGQPETLPENPGIRRFIWEHLNDVHRILWRIGESGGTVSGKKMQLCQREAVIVGHRCSPQGRYPTEDRAEKIKKWPRPTNLKAVRGFLGLCGTVRIWIKDYSIIAKPLVSLTRKGIEFTWGTAQEESFNHLKELVASAPAIRPIDYKSERPVYLSVDSSKYGIGFVLAQEDENGRRVPARYGSLPIHPVEARYAQTKLELYGLFRALKEYSLHLMGIKNLIIEVDAASIIGMLKKPVVQADDAVNRWIAGIRLFRYQKIVHVPGHKHKAPDALSRRGYQEDEPGPDPDPEGWIDDIALMIHAERPPKPVTAWAGIASTLSEKDGELEKTLRFLVTKEAPKFDSSKDLKSFLRQSNRFFLTEEGMYRQVKDRPPQKVIFGDGNRQDLMEDLHEKAGHRGEWAVFEALRLRFYWPQMREDVKYHVASCHDCQVRSTKKMHIPIETTLPSILFQKVYLDVMKMPEAGGKKWIVMCREDIAGVCEGRALAKDNARSIAVFFKEQILYRYGAVAEVVTDNGPSLRGEFEKLAKEFGIKQIKISPYNSQANGVVERGHYTIREALVKACKGDLSKWPQYLQAAIFADRITTRRATGYSPFYLLHGVHPFLPCDLAEATFLCPRFQPGMSTTDLLAARTRQLAKMPTDLARARRTLSQSRFRSKEAFEQKFGRRLIKEAHKVGSLVLVRNVPLENTMAIDRKTQCRYMGPYKVVRRTKGRSYILEELDGSELRTSVAAFRLIPYLKREELGKWKRRIDLRDQIRRSNKKVWEK